MGAHILIQNGFHPSYSAFEFHRITTGIWQHAPASVYTYEQHVVMLYP